MLSVKDFSRSYLILSVFCWLCLVCCNLYSVHQITENRDITIPYSFTNLVLVLLFIFSFLSFKIYIGTRRGNNFIEYLWQAFSIGAYTILISLFVKFFLYITENSTFAGNLLLTNLFYHLNIALMIIFLANGFYVWKKMILYQKSKITHILWHVFEYLALASIFTNFIFIDILSLTFVIGSSPLLILGLVLSFNLKWVAFLNYKQKWQSIALVFLIILISSTFLQQIYENYSNKELILNLGDNVFVLAIFSFILLNCFTSLLVLFFNLPTSSVFEQKFGEVMIFQKLSQSIQIGDKEEEVYSVLLDSSLNTVLADGAWLEIVDEKGNFKAFLNRNIDEFDIFEIKKVLRKNDINITTEPQYIKNIKTYKHIERIGNITFKSILIIPLSSHNQRLGTLVLLKNLHDGFDKEMVDIVYTFVSQASIAIKNFRLINEAVENERYKEELKIAKDVQRSLFPENLLVNSNLEMSAFSKAADEVGGDYYDVYQISEDKMAIVLGDVSGNGTSAAFTMAQMKGVFHSLIQLDIPADQFMSYANNALSRTLEKSIFITLTLFIVNIKDKIFQFARAGHCPPLFYRAADNTCSYLRNKGLGLGIIRNREYSKHIEKQDLSYGEGDIIVLYTDGITEAMDNTQGEFGFERLSEVVLSNHNLSTKHLNDKIIEELYKFTGTEQLNDDYTLLIIKFI
ncbi:MAG TPA: GAF domain-containing SpoIIE family protein phosphatase [Cytophagaceae bacterium]|jgi:sigma-B regulation protein RsbU (phosphoserine phosphatase)|nr:GAF domain-containing SpoIIE family protein phosphatase [Cytophagaceae bacterium]